MQPAEIHAIAIEEQARAQAIVAGLRHCSIVLSRATTELGAFTVERATGATQIRISRRIDDEAQIRETLRHELAHQAAWERYRDLTPRAVLADDGFVPRLRARPVLAVRHPEAAPLRDHVRIVRLDDAPPEALEARRQAVALRVRALRRTTRRRGSSRPSDSRLSP